MKKTILAAAIAMITLVSFGQQKKDMLAKDEKAWLENAKTKVAEFKQLTDSALNATAKSVVNKLDTVKIPALTKVILLDSMSIPKDDLLYILSEIKTGKLPLLVDINYIAVLYSFSQTSKNGEYATKDIDQLKMPLMPYIQALQRQDQTKQPKK